MAAGKILSLLAGIITIIATYVLSWASIVVLIPTPTTFYAYGIGIMTKLPALFTSADALALVLGVPGFVFYILAGILIVFLLSGIFILIGMKSRVVGLIGSIFVLLVGILILLGTLNIVINTDWVVLVFGGNSIIDGIIPFDLPLGPASLGLYVLIAGGALGLVAGIIGPE